MERAIPDHDYSKREAAEVAGCDERTIHRAIKADKLAARKEPLPGGGEKVFVRGADLNAWIDTREVTQHSAAVTRQPDIHPTSVTPGQILEGMLRLAENQNTLQAGQMRLAEIMQTIQRQLPAAPEEGNKPSKRQSVPLTERLTVTLDEASRMSGIPNARTEIKVAIEKKKLKAIKRKRGQYYTYRIMTNDLREWLKSLRS